MSGSKVFVDLIIEDEVALNAVASGAQCTLSDLDGNRPILQVLPHPPPPPPFPFPPLLPCKLDTTQVGSMTLFGTWNFTVNPHHCDAAH